MKANLDDFLKGGWAPARIAAQYLSRSISWVLREARSGQLPSARVGRRLLFCRDQLDEYLSRTGCKAEGGAAAPEAKGKGGEV